jgi:hypothetical protein
LDNNNNEFQFAFLDAVSEEEESQLYDNKNSKHRQRRPQIPNDMLPQFWKTVLELLIWNTLFVSMAQYIIHTFARKKIMQNVETTTNTNTTTSMSITTPMASVGDGPAAQSHPPLCDNPEDQPSSSQK